MTRELKDRSSSELFADDKLLIPIGDVTDKLIILDMKLGLIKDKIAYNSILTEWFRVNILISNVWSYYPDSTWDTWDDLYEKLYDINLEQWKCEDRVRTENSWEAAQAARTCNSKRVLVKNEINRLFDYPSEQKSYRSK